MKKILLLIAFLTYQFYFHQQTGHQDCSTAIPICSNSNITLTPSGTGNVEEGVEGCLNGEHNSIWFTFSVATPGTLTFVINPALQVDYDWALYGPNHDCNNPSATPIRCSYDGPPPYPTGLNMTSLDVSEGAGTDDLGNNSDGFTKYIDVLPGEVYYLLVDQFSGTTSQFSLEFGGTATLLTPFDYDPTGANTPVYQHFPFKKPGVNEDGKVLLCEYPTTFNFSSLSEQIINNNQNFTVKYYLSQENAISNTNPITSPISINIANTYYYAISYLDPNAPDSFMNQCREFGTINFTDVSLTLTPATLTACNNNNSGVATYDLTTVTLYNGTQTITSVKYYPTVTDAQNGTNEIPLAEAQSYTAAQGIVYVKYISEHECEEIGPIHLEFHPQIPTQEATLTECFLVENPTKGKFNLASAVVTTASNPTIHYYPSIQDAVDNTNEITNPFVYEAGNTAVYARVIGANLCWSIAKINLKVTPPTYSNVLQDKTICIEDRTTLDAGPGFTAYKWSTGATTQSINNVQAGEYWVDLTKDNCVTRQTVKVHATPLPVITGLDVNFTTVTVSVTGGNPPYQYSVDGVTWQDSNVLANIPRGQVQVFVKDKFDCEPVSTEVTVPNLVNAITPNDDNVNDYLDYSALHYKKDLTFIIYNRYGNKVYEGNKKNLYRWDGRSAGKKVTTGTYWYTITWNEPDTNAPVKYSGWVMVKNRD